MKRVSKTRIKRALIKFIAKRVGAAKPRRVRKYRR